MVTYVANSLRDGMNVLSALFGYVTKKGVWLFAAQKPVKRPGCRKGKLAVLWMLAMGQRFHGNSDGKDSTCQCKRRKRCGFDPWVGKIPWRTE